MAIRWTDSTPTLQLAHLPAAPTSRVTASPGAVDVWIAPDVDRQVMTHLQTRDVEQGGLLIGQAYASPDSAALAHVQVTDSVPADDAEGTAFSLRMGSAVWQLAQSRLRPGLMIVGWYHSHPGLTAFFSDTDRRTQAAFFNNPYSVGWVIDPSTADEALFLSGDCTPVQRGPDRTQES
jgi:proteasome lid subunit RPN8/RPN11